jgi:hypothetical protein
VRRFKREQISSDHLDQRRRRKSIHQLLEGLALPEKLLQVEAIDMQ